MGARPLKRIIQQKVEDVLSDALLAGSFADGEHIQVCVKDGEIIMQRAESEVQTEPDQAARPEGA